jgi:membrane fusion protein, multidrug efflux system
LKRTENKLFIVMKTTIVSLIPLIWLIASCRNEQIKSVQPEPVRIYVTEIKTVPAVTPLHSNGILVSSEELKLSFKTGGIVAEIPVNEGNRVTKGTVLASLDLSEINAAVEEAQLGYSKTIRDFERVSNLYTDSVATLEQKQNAATALDLAKSRLSIAKFNLTYSRIIAPENGIILKKFVQERELVAPGYPVILFGSSGSFWKVKAGFSDKDIVRINIGDSGVISFDAYPGEKFYAFVEEVGELSNPMTGTYEVEFRLKRTDSRLASGFVAGVDLFITSSDSVTVVPVESVVEANGYQGYIYILKNENVVTKLKVELVSVIGSDIAVRGIPAGIKEVVSGGAAYLRDGEKVAVVRPNNQKTSEQKDN